MRRGAAKPCRSRAAGRPTKRRHPSDSSETVRGGWPRPHTADVEEEEEEDEDDKDGEEDEGEENERKSAGREARAT